MTDAPDATDLPDSPGAPDAPGAPDLTHLPEASAEYFGPAAAPLFGWLHASAAPASLGLVLCAPLGHEMLHCRRSLRVLAAAAAAHGVPCLHFDLGGCGDSADGAGPAGAAADQAVALAMTVAAPAATTAAKAAPGGRVAGWQADIEAAIDHLQARSGVARVALLGVRSGLLLAAPVAARHPAVAALLALAPVTSGRRLLREWRALHGTAAHHSAVDDGRLAVAGFVFDADTCNAMAAIDLAALALPARLAVCVVDRDDLPAAGAWVSALRAAGLAVDASAAPGLPAMLDEPQRHVVPQAALNGLVDWLAARAQTRPDAPVRAQPPAGTEPGRAQQQQQQSQAQAAAAQSLPASEPRRLARVAPGVQERVVVLAGPGSDKADSVDRGEGFNDRGSRIALFGIVSEPAAPAPSAPPTAPLLLLVNTGPVHHIGGHRLYVRLARRLALRGQRVLRFDLSGLGDSPARPGQAAGEVYGPHAVADIAQALAAVQARWPGAPVQLLGLCSGGYHALKFAVAQRGAVRATIVNPLVFFWHEGMSLEASEVDVQAAYYRSKWRRLESWKRLFSGQSDLRLLLHVAAGRAARALQALHALPALVRRQRTAPGSAGAAARLPDDLGRELQAAVAHGARLQFVFSEGEPGWPLLQSQAGQALHALQARGMLAVHHIERADHTFSSEDARERFIGWLEGALDEAPADAAVRPLPQPSPAHA